MVHSPLCFKKLWISCFVVRDFSKQCQAPEMSHIRAGLRRRQWRATIFTHYSFFGFERVCNSEVSSTTAPFFCVAYCRADNTFKTPRFRTSHRRFTTASIGLGCSIAVHHFRWPGRPRAVSPQVAGILIAN